MPKGIKGFQKGHTIGIGNKNNLGKHWKIKDTSKMSEAKKGIKRSEESKRKQSETNKGKKSYEMTDEIRKKMSKSAKIRVASGKHNWWKNGISTINEIIRKSMEYKLWRTAVFERDNYTCIWCGTKSGNGKAIILHADHIKRFADYPELRFAIDNGRTLCRECHRKTNTWGRPKNL